VAQKQEGVAAWSNIRIQAPRSVVETDFRKDLCGFWDSTGFYVNMTSTATETTVKASTVDMTTETTGRATSVNGTLLVWLVLLLVATLNVVPC